MRNITRRDALRGALLASGAVLAASIPTVAVAATPGTTLEKTIAAALNSAAIRQKFTPKETWDIATRVGVTLEQTAPRATPWLKLIGLASPVGRVITIVSAVALAYDVVKDIWNAAPNKTATKGTYDGNIVELCPQGQTCKYTDANGTFYIMQTRETSASQSNWTYYGQYPVLKQVALGAGSKPFVYTVYWKVGTVDLPYVMDPRPTTDQPKKQVVPPGNLREYLDQFANDPPNAIGLSQSINDMLDKMMQTNGQGLRTGLQTIADDVAKAIAGLGTKLGDLFDDSPYDRAPQLAIDPTTGLPNPNPGTQTGPITGSGPGTSTNTGGGVAPGTGTGTGTGTETGTGQCLPGSADCPAEVNWGTPPAAAQLQDVTANPFAPSTALISQLPTGECPTITFDFFGHHVFNSHCAAMESQRGFITTLCNIGASIVAFTILMRRG